MATIQKAVEILNDLIRINNDRVAGFESAVKDLKDPDEDIKSLFTEYADQSRKNAGELSATITQAGGDVDASGSTGGAIHRAWIDVKAVFTGHDRKGILEEAERGEDAIKKAYGEALSPDNELNSQWTEIISRQADEQKAAHNKVKALRDSQ